MPENESQSLNERASRVVELARKAGADGAFAHASRVRSVNCEVRNGKLETLEDSTSRSIQLQVYAAGRYSTHSTTDLEQASLEGFVRDAVALTLALQPDPHRALPDAELFRRPRPQGLELFDPRVVARTQPERIEQCQRMNARLAGKEQIISASSSVYDSHAQLASVSSNGFSGSFETTRAGLYSYATLKDVGDSRPEGGHGMSARHEANLLEPEAIGDEALKRARWRLGTVKGPTMVGPLVVDRLAASSLIRRLLGPASGAAIQQKRSMWAGQLNKRRVSSKLTIINDPTLAGGLGSAPYDDEGISAFVMPVIEKGALKNNFVDTYYARKLGTRPTTARQSNIVVRPGSRDAQAIVGGVKKGIYLTSWLGGNADSTTGDFSFGLRGHLIEKGKITTPVGEMNVTGNLLALFDRLAEVGNDPWLHSRVRVPTLVFDDVQFSGV